MNLPNKLTVGRIGLTVLMTICLTTPAVPYRITLALLIFIVASLTDYWDGYLARKHNIVSSFGQLMDPLTDKILACAAFVGFVALHAIPAWIVIVVISREFVVTGLRLLAATKGQILPAGRWGKQKMMWQIILILVTLSGLAFQDELLPLILHGDLLARVLTQFSFSFIIVRYAIALLVAALTLISGAVYLWQNRALYLKDI
jgi:CDP-diacylglycerol--glycerol-3-phosphate 3-phosphatidyltransferase